MKSQDSLPEEYKTGRYTVRVERGVRQGASRREEQLRKAHILRGVLEEYGSLSGEGR